ncbi:Putative AC transposase [Linum perenne]
MENPNNSQNNVPATPTQTQTPPNAATPPVQQPSTEAVLIGAETVVAADGQGYPQGEIQQVQSSGRKLKSDVWPHFQRLQVNGELKAKCIYCRKLLCGHSNNGTTHLRNHRDGCIQKKIHDGRQKILGPNFIGKIQPDLTVGQANIFFPKVCDIRMALMEWLYDPNPLICDMANKMWLKFAKYWDDIHLVLAVSVVLDPRYKLHVIEYYADKFGSTNVDIVGERVKNVVCDLVLEYQRKTEKKSSTSSAKHDVNVPTSSTVDLDFELYVRQRKKSKTTSVTTELDHYLAEALIPRTSVDFDVLMWWRLNGAKYPTLQEMARDLLAIPITSVASESAFSSGGRLLDPHRSRLHFSLVEAMMCTRSWIKDDMKRGNSLILFTLCLCYLISFEIVCT